MVFGTMWSSYSPDTHSVDSVFSILVFLFSLSFFFSLISISLAPLSLKPEFLFLLCTATTIFLLPKLLRSCVVLCSMWPVSIIYTNRIIRRHFNCFARLLYRFSFMYFWKKSFLFLHNELHYIWEVQCWRVWHQRESKNSRFFKFYFQIRWANTEIRKATHFPQFRRFNAQHLLHMYMLSWLLNIFA